MTLKTLLLTSLLALSSAVLAKVNINTANVDGLSTLNGIGQSKAAAIITYRKEHGDFKNLDELSKVKGIGKTTTDKLKKDISLSGKTTLPTSKAAKKSSSSK